MLETVGCLRCIWLNDALRICSKVRYLKEGLNIVPKENALDLYLNISFISVRNAMRNVIKSLVTHKVSIPYLQLMCTNTLTSI
jgi:hypothetical protein